jgi:hypothetical protein
VSFPRTFREARDWLLGRDPLPPPNPDRTVEAAWVPAWQGQMLTDELIAGEIPAVVVEDFNLNLMMHSREPMARIFVTEDRKAEAESLIEEIIGHPPRHRGL